MSISTWEASSARSPAVTCSRFQAYTALQQADGERPGRAEAGPGRDVGEAHDLERRADGVLGEHRTNDRMLDLPGLRDPLEGRVLEEVVVRERPVDPDVDVLVDRGRDHESAAALVVRR